MSHIHERMDFTVGVFVVYKNTVLLRLHEKYHIWLPVGGHIEPYEDPIEACIREVKEEVGLDVKIWNGYQKIFYDTIEPPYFDHEIIPPVGMVRHVASKNHDHVDMRYFAIAESNEIIPESPNDKWQWLTYEELDSVTNTRPYIIEYAKLALKELGEK